MVVDQINLREQLKNELVNFNWRLEPLTQEEYDLLQKKDPITLYITTDTRRAYNGDIELPLGNPYGQYFVQGVKSHPGEYSVNLCIDELFFLVEIERWPNAEAAIRAMDCYNRLGSHMGLDSLRAGLIFSYIDKTLSLHEMIVGLLSLQGYRDDIRLQEVIQLATGAIYRANKTPEDFNSMFRDDLKTWKMFRNPLFGYYAAIYDVVVLFNHFKEFKEADVNSEVLTKIQKVFE